MDIEKIKQQVCRAIDDNADKIIEIGENILHNPELGYKEEKTAALVKDTFNRLNISFRDKIAITGVKGILNGKKSDITVAVLGEMDAVTCETHPLADKQTGAAHSCGHNAQIAAMLGCAMGLCAVSDELDGNVCFFAVPAEEFIEMDYRQSLADKGLIKFFGGKQELIRLGEFNDIDMAMMVHAEGCTPQKAALVNGSSLGFVAKTAEFFGKAAHAGGAPYDGINALNAANLALAGINAQRETFRDEDRIRVHPIITKGGEIVNVVPAHVKMETYVRGATFKAINDANEKVDRAINGAAYIIGAEAKITDVKGYLPLLQNEQMSELFEVNAEAFIDKKEIYHGVDMVGSSDIGDLSHIIPCIQPTMGGYNGAAHAKEFSISDKTAAYILPAKLMAMTVVDLLADGARKAKQIKDSFEPQLTVEEYINI